MNKKGDVYLLVMSAVITLGLILVFCAISDIEVNGNSPRSAVGLFAGGAVLIGAYMSERARDFLDERRGK